MTIENFRGIPSMDLSFNKDINIIIGENGSSKSTIIDAIRLLYNLGEPIKELFVKNEDFATNLETGGSANIIKFTYEFRGLTDSQKGALYEYIVLEGQRICQILLKSSIPIDMDITKSKGEFLKRDREMLRELA
ncbi:AAA family ATPase [Paenibacillus hexagrammi]|uniref:AAA family ATPase n=1 Tax=Paenibacillus hexagrammi TaxID=2908839 RepID=A0ABY3SIW2_9BACL|nr:AAA family ATPase [Paenibacillus sp. YPD9-1]UJF33738.1 AAA family ATPase [Paenibacillus sp. YPD9-1]